MVLLLALALLASIPGSLDIDPALHWYTLETDNFAVHFPSRGRPGERQERLAREIAAIAEQVHSEVTARAGWSPRPRTDIVVADFFDYSNGWAAPLPGNTITVIPTPPSGNRTNYDNWLRTLVAHEYAHIVQMDMVRALPEGLRGILGRVVVPNALLPVWMLEGYAIGYESELTGFGRAVGSEYRMMLRAAADSGRLLGPDRCATYELRRYPGGTAPYLYGGQFCRHVAGQEDARVWDDYARRHSGAIPFTFETTARRTFDGTIAAKWRGWLAEERRTADSVARLLSSRQLTGLDRLTWEGFRTGSPCWSQDGRSVYYLCRTGTEYPAVRSVRKDGAGSRVLHAGLVEGSMSLAPNGRLLAFGERTVQHGFYEYSDIRALDLVDGSLTWLTSGLRARDPDFSPDSTLVFVSGGSGSNDLMLLDLASGELSNLTENAGQAEYHSPRFSPGGRYIAVGVHRPGGHADIELLDLRTGWSVPVTQDRASDLAPCWDRTGRFLYFVSDRTGVYNVHAYSIRSGKTYRCTNVLYGVFEPALSPDNRQMALTSHSAAGDDISLVDIKATNWIEAAPCSLPTEPLPARPPDVSPELYHYSPFPSILPKFWAPYVVAGNRWDAGAFTLGWDALRFHQYLAAAGCRFGDEDGPSPFLRWRYRLTRYRPEFEVTADLDLHRQRLGVRTDIPFRATRRITNLGLGYVWTRDSSCTGRFDLSVATSSALRYRFGVAPASGTVVSLYSDLESRTLSGLRDRLRVFHRLARYLAVGSTSRSLKLRLDLGVAVGNASADSAWAMLPGRGVLAVRGHPFESRPYPGIILPGVEFRCPLFWPERGFGTLPVFLSNINAGLFVEAAVGLDELLPVRIEADSIRLGFGAEFGLDLVLGHLVPVSLKVGCAFGAPGGRPQVYLGLESSLLGELLDRNGPEKLTEPARLHRAVPR